MFELPGESRKTNEENLLYENGRFYLFKTIFRGFFQWETCDRDRKISIFLPGKLNSERLITHERSDLSDIKYENCHLFRTPFHRELQGRWGRGSLLYLCIYIYTPMNVFPFTFESFVNLLRPIKQHLRKASRVRLLSRRESPRRKNRKSIYSSWETICESEERRKEN